MDNNTEMQHWHVLSAAEALSALGADADSGLSAQEAGERLARFGENRLREETPRPLWLKFLDQFKSLMVIVLLVAAVLSLGIGAAKDAVVILVVVVLNALLGFYQEHRAEQTLAALKGMLALRARVRRDGRMQEVEAAGLVPGDIVLLEAGERVPADGRLLEAHSLEIQESALTGESQAVGKSSAALRQQDLPLGDRNNMLFMNTVVTRGRAKMLVTGTGMQTAMGGLAETIALTPDSPTPLQRQLDVLGKRLAAIAGIVVPVIFTLTVLRGAGWTDAAMTSVALAVAAIPEGLPAVVTVTLAVGMWRMGRKQAILKKLAAVETLGSTTVICTDKTGTLTLNQMTARAGWCAGHHFTVTGQGYEPQGDISGCDERPLTPLLLAAALCNESRVNDGQLIGDPTEGALYVLAEKGGIDPLIEQQRRPRIAEIPFDSEHKFMATFHHRGDIVDMYIKGAPDVLLDHVDHWLGDHVPMPVDEATRAVIRAENETLAGQALRVIAMARREIPANTFDPAADLWQWAGGWTFLGLVGLMDPPRPEAAQAIARCREAGVQVKMITGDHKATAAAIALELGLDGEVTTGAEVERMTEAELCRAIPGITVFARVAPQHKVKIVKALKAIGHVTAMTGDGVNDAPALKTADIGIAMGITGTAVAKEAATLVLTDDNFATIVHAVEEGRLIYDNILKFVRFQLSTNIAAILTVLGATLAGLPVPFTAIQLLWINIIMDGPPAMTLGVEPARAGLMKEAPRTPGTQILPTERLLRLVVYGCIMMAGTLAIFTYSLKRGDTGTASLTMAFTTFVLFQFFNVFNARAEHETTFNANFLHNRKLWLALSGVLLLQVVVVHWPLAQAVFGTASLSAADWLLSTAVASSVLLTDEARKLMLRLLNKSRKRARA